ncbi:MAG: cytochrome c [Gammaproteobacteria bacterium]|nr:cytochrome c [Gammaproteobacteria bacterium]
MVKLKCLAGVFLIPTLVWADPDPDRQAELAYLLYQDCGSCHGMTLKGGLGPPLLPETLRNRSDEALVAAIMDGRPGTPMPPWRTLLSKQEARWLISVLRSGDRP